MCVIVGLTTVDELEVFFTYHYMSDPGYQTRVCVCVCSRVTD